MSDKLTQDQVDHIYNKLDKDNESATENLKQAIIETENTKYDSITKMEGDAVLNPLINDEQLKEIGLDDDTIKSLTGVDPANFNIESTGPSDKNYKEVFSEYNISDEEGTKLLEIISQYKEDKSANVNYYSQLPDKIKVFVDALRVTGEGKISKNAATKVLLDSFINDATFGGAVDEYSKEMSDVLTNSNKEFNNIFKSAMNDMWSDDNINKLKETNPSEAERLENLKLVFENAKSFKKQLDYLDTITAKKLTKFTNRYKSECFYFDTKFKNNDFGIKFPTLDTVRAVIRKISPGFTDLQVKKFVVVISKTCSNLDTSKIEDVAYAYSMINNIVSYQFALDLYKDDEDGNKLFTNIGDVIRKIINLG